MQADEAQPPDREGHDFLSRREQVWVLFSLNNRWIAYAAIAVAIVLSWLLLGLMSAGAYWEAGVSDLGPGYLQLMNWLGITSSDLIIAIGKLCLPASPTDLSWTIYAATVAMWCLMAIAMMLPSAAPMLKTYADISNVARRDDKPVVSISYLATGYLAVWGIFSVIAASVQLAISQLVPAQELHFPIQGVFGGMILIAAGAYQFSSLKDMCLEKCRNPFNVLFAKWTDNPRGIFALGVEQGLYCLGCCWALMLVMLVVGTMNLAWMAFFALFAILEKNETGKVTSVVSGGILILWGVSLIILAAAKT